MGFGRNTRPIHWQEGEYTVTRTAAWSPPGDHPVGTGLLLYVNKEGILEKVEGDPECWFTQGGVPIRNLTLPEYIYHKDRVIYPLKRDPKDRGNHAAWERCTWDEALDIIEAKYREIVEDFGSALPVMQLVGTGRQAGVHSPLWCCSVFNTPQMVYMQSGWSCAGPRTAAFRMITGASYFSSDHGLQFPDFMASEDYVQPEVWVLWGKEPLKSNPDGFWGHSIVEAVKRGTKLIVIDPRLTWPAAHAEHWLQIRPGTDAALAMAIADTIIKEELYDYDFMDKWTYGFAEFAERVATMPASKAAEICDVKEEDIIAVARRWATAKPACFEMGLAVDQNPNGNQVVHCLIAILCLTGSIDTPGATVCGEAPASSAGFPGFSDLDPKEELMAAMVGRGEYPAVVEQLNYAVTDSALDQLLSDEPYPFRMTFATGTNPMACANNCPDKWEEGFRKMELNVVCDLFMTPFAESCCDIFLPIATFAEQDMYVNYWYGDAGLNLMAINKAIEPLGECKSDLEALLYVGKRIRPEIFNQYEDAVDYMNKGPLAPMGFTFQELAEHGWWHPDYEYKKYERGLLRGDRKPGFNTPTGRIELWSTMYNHYGEDPLPYYIEPPTSPVSTPEYAEKYPYILSTGQRTWSYFHSENRQIQTLRDIEPDPLVEIGPQTAQEAGVSEGDWVWLENDNGRAQFKVSIRPGVKEGCLFAQHGWWFPERQADAPSSFGLYDSNINNLTPYKEIGKMGFGAPYKCLMCTMYKVKEGELYG